MAARDFTRLTSMAACAGWAAKMAPGSLAQMLAGFDLLFPDSLKERILVGLGEPDGAAVYRLDDTTALIFTADCFPPVVDDPRGYGAIAATSALKDVYATGGRPALALNLASCPDDMPPEVAREILGGASEKTGEAGAVIAGGHTTRGEEPTFGLAVGWGVSAAVRSIGIVRQLDALGRFVLPAEIRRRGGILPGDRLAMFIAGDALVIRKYTGGCVFCGARRDLSPFGEHRVCRACRDALASLHAEAHRMHPADSA